MSLHSTGITASEKTRTGPDRTRRMCERSHATFAVDDVAKKILYLFAICIASDRSSGFIFAGDKLGASGLTSLTLYPFASELVT